MWIRKLMLVIMESMVSDRLFNIRLKLMLKLLIDIQVYSGMLIVCLLLVKKLMLMYVVISVVRFIEFMLMVVERFFDQCLWEKVSSIKLINGKRMVKVSMFIYVIYLLN